MFLEPMSFSKNVILVNELEEFNQIYFIRKGHFLVGFEMNKEKKYCLSFKNNNVIGAYGMTFRKRSDVIYKTKTRCFGTFIRKTNWMELEERNPQIFIHVKKNILMDYCSKI